MKYSAAGQTILLKRRRIMIRKIIKIDEEKCNGCGACASACHEGAIEMVDGKARLTREDYCDGLGDCLPAKRPLITRRRFSRKKQKSTAICPAAAPERIQNLFSARRILAMRRARPL